MGEWEPQAHGQQEQKEEAQAQELQVVLRPQHSLRRQHHSRRRLAQRWYRYSGNQVVVLGAPSVCYGAPVVSSQGP